ncbi:STAS domain-containing protein [Nonomuraea jiangxiensis]|uniref:Anti-sigma factor antagonist n=1 Tax=Nonomuraea jiangxiensis TaxID=633440 RepID=A0A1G8TPM1_9ACTN|nr:STAS domain-containing protein [Nonomuraea jiangxiensis]SDJ42865.1 anti-anti-sigma factor [Nonomuraea jiangxiensis]
MEMSPLQLQIRELPDCDVIHLGGELDLFSHAGLRWACTDLLQRHHTKIVIDATRLDFCDCAGLNILINAQREAERQGGFLRLIGVHGQLARLLTVAALIDQFPPYADLRQARGLSTR